MLNQVIIVGRLRKVIDLGENNGAIITIENSRPFKNADGIYESDFIDVRIFDGIKNSLIEYAKENDLIGVRGRVQVKEVDGNKIIEIEVDKITFLSNNVKKEN
jgi:single-strand DNA-binding protein